MDRGSNSRQTLWAPQSLCPQAGDDTQKCHPGEVSLTQQGCSQRHRLELVSTQQSLPSPGWGPSRVPEPFCPPSTPRMCAALCVLEKRGTETGRPSRVQTGPFSRPHLTLSGFHWLTSPVCEWAAQDLPALPLTAWASPCAPDNASLSLLLSLHGGSSLLPHSLSKSAQKTPAPLA